MKLFAFVAHQLFAAGKCIFASHISMPKSKHYIGFQEMSISKTLVYNRQGLLFDDYTQTLIAFFIFLVSELKIFSVYSAFLKYTLVSSGKYNFNKPASNEYTAH